MKKTSLLIVSCYITLILLTGCEEAFLFSSNDDQFNDIIFNSLQNGSIINGKESITFQILSSEGSNPPEKLEIKLSALDGSQLGSEIISPVPIKQELKVVLPELESGQYLIDFSLSSGNSNLVSKKVSFFYTNSPYKITGIESFPPSITPGSTVLLKSILDIPDKANPYIKWIQNKVVLSSGLLSEGKNKILWDAPEEEGIYIINVELFPDKPIAFSQAPMKSSINMEVELYVSNNQQKAFLDSLYPKESFFTLFHFAGNLKNEGLTRNGQYFENPSLIINNAKTFGNTELITLNDEFAYKITKNSGIQVDNSILPVKEGKFLPFTLSMGLILDKEQENRNILKITSPEDENFFTISMNKQRFIQAQFSFDHTKLIIPSNIYAAILENQRILLSISVFIEDDTLKIKWFLNGEQKDIQETRIIPYTLPAAATTIIGGENGFTGIIDELSVYFKDGKNRNTIHPDLFRNAMKMKSRKNLVYAEGFDGLFIPDDLVMKGEASVENGILACKRNTSLTLPAIIVSDKSLDAYFSFLANKNKNSSILLYWENDESPFMRIERTEDLKVYGIDHVLIIDKPLDTLMISIPESKNNAVFSTIGSKENISIKRPDTTTTGLVIKILNKDSSDLLIDSILILKN
ncbi:MAG: hypothetical protein JW969_16315 [Spirochaetales bacterium]|nr:hypothetical protein [Spirochaetales bacterium]